MAAAPNPRDPLRRILGLQTTLVESLTKLLESILVDSDEQLERNLQPGKGGVIRRAQIRNAKRANAKLQGGLFRKLGSLIKGLASDAVVEATKAGSLYDGDYLESLGMNRKQAEEYHKSLEQSARRSVEAAVNRNLDQTGTTKRRLSERVYNTLSLSNGLVDRRIESGLARGLSAKELAKEVRDLISPDVRGGVSYAAMRLARTELNNAFHYQQVQDAQEKPWVTGLQWNLSKSHPEKDICDTIAAGGSEGKGKGVYGVNVVPPKPHPHCLCYLTPVTMDPDEFEERLINGEFDAWENSRKS